MVYYRLMIGATMEISSILQKSLLHIFTHHRYHIYCVGLDDIPSGRWHCVECAICSSCGAKDPSGEDFREPGKIVDTQLSGTANWTNEYKNNAQGTKIFSQQFCVPCHK